MDLNNMLAMANRLRKMQSSNRFLETLIGNRPYNTSTQTQQNTTKRVTLYSKISPLGNSTLTPELDDWMDNGNKVRFAELQRIVRDLRKRKRFSQALEVYDWMNRKGLYVFPPTEHAVRLDLIGKVHGFHSAEEYFNNLKDQDKTDKTYGSLLHCYVRQLQTDKSLLHVEKMKQMGFTLSTLQCNDIMCLYARTGQHEKVHDMLREMKKSGVSPDNLSYRISINSYGEKMDIEGMENVLKEMENQPDIVMDWNTYDVVANFYIKASLKEKANNALKKSEGRLVKKDGIGYNHLISLHARLGNKAEVLRLWELEKKACKKCINRDYITMLQSLIKLGELDEAKKLLEEWHSSGNCYEFRLPYVVISGYIDKGLCDKAKAMLDNLVKIGKSSTPESWSKVATAYMKKGEMEKAINCMKAAFALPVEKREWKLNPNVIECLLDGLGEKASVEDVESFFSSLRNVMAMNKRMYHTLIKAYMRSGKEVGKLLDRMKADKIEADEGTSKILGTEQEKV